MKCMRICDRENQPWNDYSIEPFYGSQTSVTARPTNLFHQNEENIFFSRGCVFTADKLK